MSEGARSVGLVVEAEADAGTVRLLVDRMLLAEVAWATNELLDSLRAWRGIDPDTASTA
ncbi:MAG: hypothetical protein KDK70_08140 [Myxococcales bacterium]|nr:hypothetical protein [Myxococcales bacterium]